MDDSLRRTLTLIRGLPQGSNLSADWSRTDHFIGTVIELLHAQLLTFIRANSDARDLPDPLTIPRPGMSDKPVMSTTDEIRQFFGGGTDDV